MIALAKCRAYDLAKLMTILYQYRRINEHALRIISHNEIYLQSPLQFNDPFDCRAFFDVGTERAEWESFVAQFASTPPFSGGIPVTSLPGISISEHRIAAQSGARRAYEGALDRLGVLCLTEDPENILMWSHYADHHKGLCLEFDIAFDDLLATSKVVTYSDRLTSVSPSTRDVFGAVKLPLLTKASQWKYEREWRCIDQCATQPRLRTISSNALKSVIVGRNLQARILCVSPTPIGRAIRVCH